MIIQAEEMITNSSCYSIGNYMCKKEKNFADLTKIVSKFLYYEPSVEREVYNSLLYNVKYLNLMERHTTV